MAFVTFGTRGDAPVVPNDFSVTSVHALVTPSPFYTKRPTAFGPAIPTVTTAVKPTFTSTVACDKSDLDRYFACIGKDASTYTVSQAGIDHVKSYEGYVPVPYNDGEPLYSDAFYSTNGTAKGNCTIGYGHLIHLGPCNGSEQWGTVDSFEAEQLLESEIQNCGSYVSTYTKVKITQNQFDMMASLICNWGYGKYAKSEFLNLLNAGKYVDAAIKLKTTAVYGIGIGLCPGLVKRREAESIIFLQVEGQ